METNNNKEETPKSEKELSLKERVLGQSSKPPLDIKILMSKSREHIDKVKAEVLKYAGKPGCNPYVWLKLNSFNLAEEIIRSPESFSETTISTILTKVLNTKAEIPTVSNPIIPSAAQVNKILKSKNE